MDSNKYELNLEKLESIPEFRAELLYFIRLTNSYIQGIFWDAFPSSNKNRREKLYEFVNKQLDINEARYSHLRNAILPDLSKSGKRIEKSMDCISGIFTNQIIKELPKDLQDHFEKISLKYNHGLFIRLKEDFGRNENLTLFKLIEILKTRRHYLEKY